jgi:hypothetical protein
MIGSTLIYETDTQRLHSLGYGLDMLTNLETVMLNAMQTIDFVTICMSANIDWFADNDPILFDETSGIAVALVAPKALEYVLTTPYQLPSEQANDLSKLRAFVQNHGTANI